MVVDTTQFLPRLANFVHHKRQKSVEAEVISRPHLGGLFVWLPKFVRVEWLNGACLVESHSLHLAGKSAYSSCDGEPATTQSLRASELIKDSGRICILSDRN
jgi:hypothetical protein